MKKIISIILIISILIAAVCLCGFAAVGQSASTSD